MPRSVVDFTQYIKSLERKLRALRRNILGTSEAGREALVDPNKRLLFEATLESAHTDWLEFKRYFDDLADSYLEQGQEEAFPNEHWDAIYDELLKEIRTSKGYLMQLQRSYKEEKPPQTDLTQLIGSLSTNASNSKAHLPKIQIPEFSGDLWKWTHFRDTFVSLVHEVDGLSNVEKLHYLLGALKGEAASLVSRFPVEDRSYIIAWEKLVSTYDDPRVLATVFVQRILDTSVNDIPDERRRYERFLSGVADSIDAFKGLRLANPAEFLLASLALRTLDGATRRNFELSRSGDKEFPTCEEVVGFVRKRLTALKLSKDIETGPNSQARFKGRNTSRSKGPSVTEKRYQSAAFHMTDVVAGRFTQNQPRQRNKNNLPPAGACRSYPAAKGCPLCKGRHTLGYCLKFVAMQPALRREFVLAWKGCANCLRDDHNLKECPSKWNCRFCKQRHHSLIHHKDGEDNPGVEQTTRGSHQDAASSENGPKTFIGFGCSPPERHTLPGVILLGTVRALVRDVRGRFQPCRALLDCGSQRSFVSKNLALQLGVPISPCSGAVTGLGGDSITSPMGSIYITLTPHPSAEKLSVNCLVVDRISSELPNSLINDVDLHPIQQQWLADDEFFIPKPVDLLIGCDLYPRLITGAPYPSGIDDVHLLPSIFGLVVIGRLGNKDLTETHKSFFIESDCAIEKQLHAFWEIEEPNVVIRSSPQDAYCEEQFAKTHFRTAEGRYCVQLPLTGDLNSLGNNRDIASKRFFALERKMNKDPQLSQHYRGFMEEYAQLGHMSPASGTARYVIPHHPVWQQNPGGPKLRVVFDASCPSVSNSLNDIFLAGPKLQKDLSNILILFRLYAIPICADLVKMYRQILIHPGQRWLQHVFWRDSPFGQLEEFELNTVTYGLKPSAFLAMRAIQQLVSDEGKHFPLASSRIGNSMYVDDIVTGADSIQEAVTLCKELCGLFAKGGFTLGKWAMTKPEVMVGLEGTVAESIELTGDSNTLKILGMGWSTRDDMFFFTVRQPPFEAATKRSILSSVARIFDPLGLLAPVVLLAKIILQDLWKAQITWDEPLPPRIANEWRLLASEWTLLTQVVVPRYIGVSKASLKLIGFCDASDRAYAAAVYLRSENSDGEVKVSLIKAKTKVTPLKYLSTARLELCGSLLLAQLLASIELPSHNPMHFWCFTDSTVVLAWLRIPTHALKTFEANRVSKIFENTKVENWRYVRSQDNPADIASRGCSPSSLKDNCLWWRGPKWLSKSECDWPMSPDSQVPAPDTYAFLARPKDTGVKQASDEWMRRFSSFQTLVRVTAWIIRFHHIALVRSHPVSNHITAEEYDRALLKCVFVSQRAHFPKSSFVSRTVPKEMRQLSPFFDHLGIIRVGGRLCNASLSYSAKHPMLVPRGSHLAGLIVDDIHLKHFHSGPTLTLALLRNRFWIPGGYKFVRSRILKCVQCRIRNAAPLQPPMAALPLERVSENRPFYYTGLDYAGPFPIKESNRRNTALGKAYLSIFVCMSTRAVHLEAVSSLSTTAFLAALERFTARRGLPRIIWSDNGTNFVGASRFLKDVRLWLAKNEEYFARSLAPKGITWKFIPPRAPHFGGLWEAAVKSAKRLLMSTIGKHPFNFEELATVFTQIEGVLNSRPLCALSEDTGHWEFLTPGHFLTGGPLSAIPELSYGEEFTNRPLRWADIRRRTFSIWQRWRKEYLHTLQQRGKWTKNQEPLKIGDLVILSEKKALVGHWPVGRIVEVHPGKDGMVRVVTVRTPQGSNFVRATSSVVPLFNHSLPSPGEK